jgi:hypothetical protein
MSGADFPHTACAVCGHVLNRYTGSFGETWVHVLEEDNDHPAVPVPSDSIRTIILCDFCLVEGARWVLPVENYSIEPGGRNVGDWQSCDACAALLERADWQGLTQRAFIAARQRGQTDGLDWDVFEAMYRQLRGHVIGRVHLVQSS